MPWTFISVPVAVYRVPFFFSGRTFFYGGSVFLAQTPWISRVVFSTDPVLVLLVCFFFHRIRCFWNPKSEWQVFYLTVPVSFLPSPFFFRRVRCFVMSQNVKAVLFLDEFVMLEAWPGCFKPCWLCRTAKTEIYEKLLFSRQEISQVSPNQV